MGGNAREQRLRASLAEESPRQPGRGRKRHQPEPSQQQRVPRHLQWPERVGEQILPTRHEGVHERLPGWRIGPDPALHGNGGALQEHRRAVVEWVGYRRGRLDPLEAVPRQWQVAEERRANPQGMDRRTDVVDEPRQRQRLAPCTSARRVSSFAEQDLQPGPRQHDGGRQPVRA